MHQTNQQEAADSQPMVLQVQRLVNESQSLSSASDFTRVSYTNGASSRRSGSPIGCMGRKRNYTVREAYDLVSCCPRLVTCHTGKVRISTPREAPIASKPPAPHVASFTSAEHRDAPPVSATEPDSSPLVRAVEGMVNAPGDAEEMHHELQERLSATQPLEVFVDAFASAAMMQAVVALEACARWEKRGRRDECGDRKGGKGSNAEGEWCMVRKSRLDEFNQSND